MTRRSRVGALLTRDDSSAESKAPTAATDPALAELCRRLVAELGQSGWDGASRSNEVDWASTLSKGEGADLAGSIGRGVLDACGLLPAAAVASFPSEVAEPAQRLVEMPVGSPRRATSLPARVLATLRTWLAVGKRRERTATGFAWVQNIGVILILFALWQVWGTSIGEHHAQSALASKFDQLSHRASSKRPAGGGVRLVPATVRLPQPAEGWAMARLQIPAIGLDQYVVSGTATDDLDEGPGHYVGSAMPGQAGNVAIAGHRTTYGAPFRSLNALKAGDDIFLTAKSGVKLTYVVSGTPTAVSPNDVAVLGNFGDNRLTLTTCTPPYSAAQRLVVVAALRLPGVPMGLERLSKKPSIPYMFSSPTTSGWRLGSLPMALLAAAALACLGLGHRRLTRVLGRGARWLVLVPLWAAGIYLLFQTLIALLPNTV